MAVFLFIGSAVLLYIKASNPPGPLLFATLFGCIAIGTKAPDVTLALSSNPCIIDIISTTAILFPYPYYKVCIPLLSEDARPDFRRAVEASCYPLPYTLRLLYSSLRQSSLRPFPRSTYPNVTGSYSLCGRHFKNTEGSFRCPPNRPSSCTPRRTLSSRPPKLGSSLSRRRSTY